jgi:hypothetical protein
MIFHCTDCNEEIDCLDHESTDQAFTNLDEHIAKCPLGTFSIEATTEWAKGMAEVIRSAIQHDHLKGKLRLQVNDDPKRPALNCLKAINGYSSLKF